jgi:hypothetical protein
MLSPVFLSPAGDPTTMTDNGILKQGPEDAGLETAATELEPSTTKRGALAMIGSTLAAGCSVPGMNSDGVDTPEDGNVDENDLPQNTPAPENQNSSTPAQEETGESTAASLSHPPKDEITTLPEVSNWLATDEGIPENYHLYNTDDLNNALTENRQQNQANSWNNTPPIGLVTRWSNLSLGLTANEGKAFGYEIAKGEDRGYVSDQAEELGFEKDGSIGDYDQWTGSIADGDIPSGILIGDDLVIFTTSRNQEDIKPRNRNILRTISEDNDDYIEENNLEELAEESQGHEQILRSKYSSGELVNQSIDGANVLWELYKLEDGEAKLADSEKKLLDNVYST